MKRSAFIVPFIIGALLLVIGTGQLAAQSGMPAAGAEPITVEALGGGLPNSAAGQAITLLRVTLQPGASFPPHIHPGAVVVVVESGTFGFLLLEGEAEVTRAGDNGTPASTEQLIAGQEAILNAGDGFFEQQGVVHSARNAGDTPTSVLVAALVDPTQPFLQPMEMSATPAS